jgi:hypothetical protein
MNDRLSLTMRPAGNRFGGLPEPGAREIIAAASVLHPGGSQAHALDVAL